MLAGHRAHLSPRGQPQVVGRVAVLTSRQGEGLGSILMEAVQAHLGEPQPAELHAQAHLEAWYTRTRVDAGRRGVRGGRDSHT